MPSEQLGKKGRLGTLSLSTEARMLRQIDFKDMMKDFAIKQVRNNFSNLSKAKYTTNKKILFILP